ncbi:SGNH/GDSL hydrolase family protein [Bacillus sp. PK3_68]|uniref:SGNH/GDSL hydrolase family protein n=1 Tax=Bacillus sp. PK3_68 TaxID=2027408 RepID=UPI00217F1E07|nr:SGNH/GDSL hydrolase family protein [Bacillus sp. PK3_68]
MWIIFLAFVFSLTGCSTFPNETTEVIPKNLDVVSIGDSLTEGVGDSTESGGYIPYLQRQLEQLAEVKKARFVNYGVKGNRTDQLLKRLNQQEVRQSLKKADLVIITIGGNDIMKVFKDNLTQLSVKAFDKQRGSYEERLDKVIQTVRKENRDAGIVLVGLYNPFMKVLSDVKEVSAIIDDWNEASKHVVEQYDQTCFVTVEDLFENTEENLLYNDQFHPNDKGYEQIANRIFETIDGQKLEELTNKKLSTQMRRANEKRLETSVFRVACFKCNYYLYPCYRLILTDKR